MSSTKPIIAIVGAAGGQGSSVVKTFLKDPSYQVRGLTRNPSSPSALVLKDQGVEIVQADLNNYSSLVAAFKDATIIYGITDFFEPFSTSGRLAAIKIETQQGLNIARAASSTPTLKHFIWSTLANPSKVSNGKYNIPHFVGKNEVDEFIKKDEGLREKTTFLWNTFYASNYTFPVFQPNYIASTGKHILFQPVSASTPITLIGDQKTNVGIFVHAIVSHPELTLPGKFVLAATETVSNGELLEIWGGVTGNKAEYVQISLQDFDKLWPGWGKEMGEMLEFWEEYGNKSWSGEEVVTAKELGIEEGAGLVGAKEAFKSISWE